MCCGHIFVFISSHMIQITFFSDPRLIFFGTPDCILTKQQSVLCYEVFKINNSGLAFLNYQCVHAKEKYATVLDMYYSKGILIVFFMWMRARFKLSLMALAD